MSDRYKGAILSPTAPTVTPQSAGGIYTSSQQLQYQGQGVWPSAFNNPINNSLRFRASASAYLNRTFSTPTNNKIWTWSGWVKRGVLSTNQGLFACWVGAGSTRMWFGFITSTNQITFYGQNSGSTIFELATTPVYRDPSAWYHIVLAIDTTQATASNRAKIYVNGVQVTAFSTSTYASQNTDTAINSANAHYLGSEVTTSTVFDGYMAEINFIDGQALTPSSFGTTDAYGIWQPIPYTGTYGTNGFYLPFTDNSALTTSSNVGLGKDFSGNGNYWVTNNISITAGSTYDSMVDVPTNTNQNTANYCTLNFLDKTSAVTLSAANLNYSCSSGSQGRSTLGSPTTGLWYFEHTITSSIGLYTPIIVGGCTNTKPVTDLNNEALVLFFYTDSSTWLVRRGVSGSNTDINVSGTSYPNTNDVLQIAYDPANGRVWMGKNNNWIDSSGGITGNPSTGANPTFTFTAGQSIFPAVFNVGAPYSGVLNCGQRPFAYTPPTGALRLNTYNLPTPTILAGNQYMDATLYTGAGNVSTSITNAGGFQPDFVWTKARSTTYNNILYDSVRGTGTTKSLYSDDTAAEGAYSTFTNLSSFNSNGWTIGSTSGNNAMNASGQTFVGWQWRANAGTNVSNTQGTITSTVSANTTAGFSIVTYTGPGSSGGTVGHGLGVAPSMIIVKNRSAAESWRVGHSYMNGGSSPWNYYMNLNATAAQSASSSVWNNSAPTSSVFSISNDSAVSGSGNSLVAYCFAAVSGYSAFGSYTGNGSSDGTFVYTGFRPRFILIKNTTAYNWQIWDTSRSPYNQGTTVLFPNSSDADNTTATQFDILSNGFKIRTSDAGSNGSGNSIIYAAFAENPFKISRAR